MSPSQMEAHRCDHGLIIFHMWTVWFEYCDHVRPVSYSGIGNK